MRVCARVCVSIVSKLWTGRCLVRLPLPDPSCRGQKVPSERMTTALQETLSFFNITHPFLTHATNDYRRDAVTKTILHIQER